MEKVITLKIKKLLKDNNMTVIALALKLKRTKQNIYDILNNKQQISIKILYEISQLFDVPMTYFFEDEEQNAKIDSQYKELKNELNDVRTDIVRTKTELELYVKNLYNITGAFKQDDRFEVLKKLENLTNDEIAKEFFQFLIDKYKELNKELPSSYEKPKPGTTK